MEFIDLHGHYAWEIDDGMPGRRHCRQALAMAQKQSITAIVATPHVIPGATGKEEWQAIRQRLEEFRQLAKEYGIEGYAGCELFLNHEYEDALYDGLCIPINNTRYLLAEFDVRKELGSESQVEERLYEIRAAKLIPIVAHIERYFHHKVDMDRVQAMVEKGYVLQMNTTSSLGHNGKTVQSNAMKLLERGLVHVIATDTHRSEGDRVPNMREAYQYLQGKVSEENLRRLMHDNPLAVIHGQPVQTMITEKKSLFKRLLGG